MYKKIFNVIEWIFIGIMLIILLLFFTLKVIGYDYYSVVSWSMGKEIPIGSFVCVDKLSEEEARTSLNIGDVVVCQSEGMNIPLMHKVVELNDNSVVIHGIANDEMINETFLYSDVLGKVVFSIPLLGYLTNMVSSYVFWIILCLVVVIYYLIIELIKTYKKMKSESNKE